MLNTWISEPTPVTTSSMTADNWSTWKAALIVTEPTGIQSHKCRTNGAPPGSPPATALNTETETPNDIQRTPVPTAVTSPLAPGRHNASAPLTRKPASG